MWAVDENLATSGFERPTFQPAAGRYTDCANPPRAFVFFKVTENLLLELTEWRRIKAEVHFN